MDTVLTSPPPTLARTSRPLVWTGRVLTGLSVAFLLVDAIGKLILIAPVLEASQQLGIAVEVIRPLGALLALSTVLHVIPRTEVLGALLLTAYLGGAVATHVLTGTPLWFPVAMGVILWAALCMRNRRVRALLLTPPTLVLAPPVA